MKAIIYKPTKNAMQTGNAGSKHWVLEYLSKTPKSIEPLMGWTSMNDTTQEIVLYFDSSEEAEAYAKSKGIDYELRLPKVKKIRPKAYADNFSFSRVRTRPTGH